MKIIVCVDDKNGILFNFRRQSQDREIIKRILENSKSTKLWMNNYSAKLFGTADNICVSDQFLQEVRDQEYCFIENAEIPSDGIEEITLYKWNRKYPADTYFEIDLKKEFKKISSIDFAGNSHEKITEEIYVKK